MSYGIEDIGISPASDLLVDVDAVKMVRHINWDIEDDLLEEYIRAAQELVSRYTGRQLVPANLRFTYTASNPNTNYLWMHDQSWGYLDYHRIFPLNIPKPPTTEILSFTVDGEDFSDFTADLTAEPARLHYTAAPVGNQSILTVACGYEVCPPTLVDAVRALAAEFYTNGGNVQTIPPGIKGILHHWRVWV